jgi:predicted transcriptional regulator
MRIAKVDSSYLPKDKRESIDIQMDISEFLFNYGPVKVTRIEHSCNLRDDLCKQYLNELIDSLFVRKNENDEYELMEKGKEFLMDTINLYLTHLPARLEKIEKGRYWIPIKRIPRRMEAPQSDSAV